MEEEQGWWRRIPSYWRTPLLAGGVFFALAVLLGLWIFEAPRAAGGADATSRAAAAVVKGELDTRPVLVIDAGHGGKDGGAVNAAGTIAEATVNQEMADRLAAYLAPHDWELVVVPAHPAGEYATPKSRADVASAQSADLLLSLHLNADFTPATRGFQCFPAPPGRVYHAESVAAARLLVARMRETGVPVMGESGIFYAYYQKYGPGSYEKYIVDSATLGADEPSEDESFAVLEYPGCPALLVEMWHISNGADMAQFYNEAGCDAVARALYLTVCDYFGLEPLVS